MKKLFGVRADGQEAYLYTITGGGLTAELTDHGATLVKLFVPDDKGDLSDVVLGFDSPDEYTASGTFFGATVGRCANRIGGAKFTMNGKEYKVDANDNEVNSLHGGFDPWKNRMWKVLEHTENSIRFYLLSPDGDQGMPGNAEVCVTYSLESEGILRIAYDAVSDKDTVFNLTNHSYFNLNGCQDGSILGHRLQIFADRLTEADAESLPNGTIYQAAGTPMDFRQLTAIGERIDDSFQQLQWGAGYDHNWILSDQKETSLHKAAYAEGDKSGISLTVYTDLPGLQFYSGNFLDGTPGKGGISYGKRSSFALETQYYPNSPAHPEFPQPILKKDETWKSVTVFAAGTVK